MPQQNLKQTRVVDPILSEFARGFNQPELVARTLFPLVFVPAYGGQVIEFGKEAFRLYNTKRAPGANTKRVQFGYEGKPYSIVPSALEAPVPRERMRDAEQVPGIDLARRAVALTQRALNLEHEYAAAQIARNAANYDNDHKVDLSGTNRWTDGGSDPLGDIETGSEAIADSIGISPNTLTLSGKAWKALRVHPKLIERIKHTTISSLTLDLFTSLLEDIDNVVVGKANIASGQNDAFSQVWGTDAVLGYVNTNPSPQQEEPSFAYTYVIDGHPMVETPYWDDNAKSWIYGVSFDNSPVLSGMAAGYLIQNAGAAA